MKTLLITTILILIPLAADCAIPAFPGAEGFGAYTPGGRGGRVIEVTNLDGSGPGSLRAACEAKGPRIVVFRVGGTIRLKSRLTVDEPFITIAGQTAPGQGIMLRDTGLHINTHDVIVRGLRVRVGESAVENAGSQDALGIGEGSDGSPTYNVIVDHCSFSWGIDENVGVWGSVSDFTIQWCIISEGLMNSIHHKGRHSMGILLGGDTDRTSLHHNLFAHNNQRNPRIQHGRRDVVNNVVYNWGSHACQPSGFPEVNFEGNYYKAGADSDPRRHVVSGNEIGSIYMKANVYDGSGVSVGGGLVMDDGASIADRPFFAPHVTLSSAADAYVRVLASAGCFPNRDSVDERIVREVETGAGRIIDSPGQVGGFPEIAAGTAPTDTDHDGMPDDWETYRGLNPRDPSDSSLDRDSDGYTNVEEYINSLIPGE